MYLIQVSSLHRHRILSWHPSRIRIRCWTPTQRASSTADSYRRVTSGSSIATVCACAASACDCGADVAATASDDDAASVSDDDVVATANDDDCATATIVVAASESASDVATVIGFDDASASDDGAIASDCDGRDWNKQQQN